MNMQTTTNYFCSSYKSFSVWWHFGGLQIVDSQPKPAAIIHLTPNVWKVPSSMTLFPILG